MRTGYEIEQVFVRPRGGRTEVAFVLVAPSGVTKREQVQLEGQDSRAALEQVARSLARRPDIGSVRGARLRVERRDGLVDDRTLLEAFIAAFEEA